MRGRQEPAVTTGYHGAIIILSGRLEIEALRSSRGVGELLPAASLMRIGLVRPDREDRVEHKDALSGPWFQIPAIRDRASKIFMEFPIDVSQRLGQRPNGWLHRKTETMSMTRGWIGVLADEQHTDLVI